MGQNSHYAPFGPARWWDDFDPGHLDFSMAISRGPSGRWTYTACRVEPRIRGRTLSRSSDRVRGHLLDDLDIVPAGRLATAACRSTHAVVSQTKSKFTGNLLAVRFLIAFSQPTHTIVSYSSLLISLTKFFGFGV
jgi:hypothetical protein